MICKKCGFRIDKKAIIKEVYVQAAICLKCGNFVSERIKPVKINGVQGLDKF